MRGKKSKGQLYFTARGGLAASRVVAANKRRRDDDDAAATTTMAERPSVAHEATLKRDHVEVKSTAPPKPTDREGPNPVAPTTPSAFAKCQLDTIYSSRLTMLRPALESARGTRRRDLVSSICEGHEGWVEGVVLVRPLWREMALVRIERDEALGSGLRELCSHQLGAGEIEAWVEDESGRIRLRLANDDGPTLASQVASGMVVGMAGRVMRERETFVFLATTIVLPHPLPRPSLTIDMRRGCDMVFCSGVGPAKARARAALLATVKCLGPQTVVVAGGLLPAFAVAGEENNKKRCRVALCGFEAQMRELAEVDEWYLELAGLCECLVLVPGLMGDGAQPSLPQSPTPTHLLPRTSSRATLAGSPHIFVCGGRTVAVVPGEVALAASALTDGIASPLDSLRLFAAGRHLCPCAPDAVPMVPGLTRDPFVLKHTVPDLMVAGGQSIAAHTSNALLVPDLCQLAAVVVVKADTIETIRLDAIE